MHKNNRRLFEEAIPIFVRSTESLSSVKDMGCLEEKV